MAKVEEEEAIRTYRYIPEEKLTPRKYLDIIQDKSFKDTTWRDRAACATYDPELFFPFHSEDMSPLVKRLCLEECPVRLQCLSYALYTRQNEGIWGGVTPKDRKKLWRNLQRALRQLRAATTN